MAGICMLHEGVLLVNGWNLPLDTMRTRDATSDLLDHEDPSELSTYHHYGFVRLGLSLGKSVAFLKDQETYLR